MLERDKLEAEHIERLKAILRQKLETFEDELARKTDPNGASQVIFLIEEVKMQLAQPRPTDPLSPDDYLFILGKTESWYKQRDYQYPYPDRLREQRAHWESRKRK